MAHFPLAMAQQATCVPRASDAVTAAFRVSGASRWVVPAFAVLKVYDLFDRVRARVSTEGCGRTGTGKTSSNTQETHSDAPGLRSVNR
jgi:hypothetical protein